MNHLFRRTWSLPVVALLTAVGIAGNAHAQSRRDALVQAPKLAPPSRGSVAGSVASLSFGAAELTRGAFALATPIAAPTERGPLLADYLPRYSPDAGLGEWGMGFASHTTLRRARPVGHLDFETDDLVTPWGIVVPGTDGAFYTRGLESTVRLTRHGGDWTAVTSDGTVYRFRAGDAVLAPKGIYEWNLSEVETPLGDRALLSYAKNESGRRFVTEILYGGRSGEFQHRIRVEYEPVPTPTLDYRSGAPLRLDRRVKKVVAETRDAVTGELGLRFFHELRYRESPAGVAFYLQEVQRTFASGASEPPLRYTYSFAEEALGSAGLLPLPSLDPYLASAGADGIQPDRVTFVDVDEDGRVDLEHSSKFTLVRHGEGAFTFETLAPNPNANTTCRPAPSPLNAPRTLARMAPSATAPQVVVVKPRVSDTAIVLCSREGNVQYAGVVPGLWELGPNTRLVDVDRDLKPDVIRVGNGRYDILSNTSGPAGYSFAPAPSGPLAPAFAPLSSWAQDMNGDGVVDLVARHSRGVVLWYGVGAGGFQTQGVEIAFRTTSGALLTDLGTFDITFTDANKDGLADALLSRGRFLYLFTNRGERLAANGTASGLFEEVTVPGFSQITWDIGLPVAADLAGLGEEQAVMVSGRNAFAVTLSRPESGLLTGVDDGRGGRARFEYERARPTPGIVQRQPLVTRLVVRATGTDVVDSRFDYDEPVFHTKGQYLLGYKQVRKTNLTTVESVRFHVDDDVQGLPLEELLYDPRARDVYRRSTTLYEDALFRGVRWLRQRKTTTALVGAAGEAAGEEQEIVAFDGVCPSVVRRTNAFGTVTTTTARAAIAGYGEALHCVAARETTEARHPTEPDKDVVSTTVLDHTPAGQIARVVLESGGATLPVEDVTYDEWHRPITVREHGKGEIRVVYDALGRVRSVAAADGVTAEAAAYESRADQLLALIEDHGDGAVYGQGFGYDALERFARSWTSLQAADDASPGLALSYAYADESHPARVVSRLLVDAAQGVVRTTVELSAATGAAIASATLAPEGWIFGAMTDTQRSVNRVVQRWHGPMATEALVSASADVLLAEGTELGSSTTSALGYALETQATVQAGAVRKLTTTVAVEGGRVVRTELENDARPEITLLDGDGHIVEQRDALGHATRFSYDALGRLVGIVLADGTTKKRVRYDGFGRPIVSEHTGLGRVTYAYDPSTSHIATRTYEDATGQVTRRVVYTHDAIGRVIAERHESPGGPSLEYAFDFDGADGTEGQRGFLTRVRGPKYEKAAAYRPDGLPVRIKETIPGFRSVLEETRYFDDGTPRETTHVVLDAAGLELERYTETAELDSFARPRRLLLNGEPLLVYDYDGEGRVSMLHLPDGEIFVPSYDAVTHAASGFDRIGDGWALGFHSERDARDLVVRERLDYSHGSEPQRSFDRSYGYDARGFLTGLASSEGAASYAYDTAGRITHSKDVFGDRPLVRAGAVLSAGTESYELDAAGRVTKKGDLTLVYGADGQIARAIRGETQWTFAYDAGHRRVLKEENGVPVAGYLAGGYVDAAGFVDPVYFGGQLLGVIRKGAFVPMLTDDRGTRLIAPDGSLSSASPYGMRAGAPELAAAIDYVGKGRDPDLGIVRMGVRDYDPALGMFWTPDPLFRESIEECAASPVECTLYGYAKNDPISFLDPAGTKGTPKGLYDTVASGASRVGRVAGAALSNVVGHGMDVRGVFSARLSTHSKVDLTRFNKVDLSRAAAREWAVHRQASMKRNANYRGAVDYAAAPPEFGADQMQAFRGALDSLGKPGWEGYAELGNGFVVEFYVGTTHVSPNTIVRGVNETGSSVYSVSAEQGSGRSSSVNVGTDNFGVGLGAETSQGTGAGRETGTGASEDAKVTGRLVQGPLYARIRHVTPNGRESIHLMTVGPVTAFVSTGLVEPGADTHQQEDKK